VEGELGVIGEEKADLQGARGLEAKHPALRDFTGSR